MLKYVVLASALLFTAPAFAEETCLTHAAIAEINGPTATFVNVPDNLFEKFKDSFQAVGRPIPDTVVSITLGKTPAAEGVTFLFGYDKDGCARGQTHLPDGFLTTIIGDPS